jgi:hypothetical protein
MNLNLDTARCMIGLIILAEFGMLALLGYILFKLIYCAEALRSQRTLWLQQLREQMAQIRVLRRVIESTGGQWPDIPMPARLQKKWKAARWVFKLLGIRRNARS